MFPRSLKVPEGSIESGVSRVCVVPLQWLVQTGYLQMLLLSAYYQRCL